MAQRFSVVKATKSETGVARLLPIQCLYIFLREGQSTGRAFPLTRGDALLKTLFAESLTPMLGYLPHWTN